MGRQVCKELAATPGVSEIAVADLDLGPAREVHACVSPIAKMTAAPAAIGALLVARGETALPGVFPPEGCVEPERFFPLLEARGVRVEMRELDG